MAVSSAYLRLLIFLLAILISACASSSIAFCMMYSAYKLNSKVTIYNLYVLLSYFEPVCRFMSSSNCCFLTCIQVSQKVDKVLWYSHLFKNFSQVVVIHTIEDFSTSRFFSLEFSCFSYDPTDVGTLISGSSAFFPACISGILRSHTVEAQLEGFLALPCQCVK